MYVSPCRRNIVELPYFDVHTERVLFELNGQIMGQSDHVPRGHVEFPLCMFRIDYMSACL